MTLLQEFQWKCHPLAEAFLLGLLEQARNSNPTIAELEQNLYRHCSTRLFDWLDHLSLAFNEEVEKNLKDYGFIVEQITSSYRVFSHPGAQLPKIILKDQEFEFLEIAVAVDSISDFLMMHHCVAPIEGTPFSNYRRSCIAIENETSLWVIERRGTTTMEPTYLSDEYLTTYFYSKELWERRPRSHSDEDQVMEKAMKIAQEIISLIGQDPAAALVLDCERRYWQARNTAGQLQKNRQDRLGMGWANHDHHTFRSSRKNFHHLVRLFEMLGFHCRERYYAGNEAGWGAQIMENPRAQLVLFLDVDLDPQEIAVDFAHHPISDLHHLGTIGLWCALHGDSIGRAGMHHLEAQFLFDNLSHDLSQSGIRMMDPFSSFPYLKQAFTAGEIWPVDRRRIQALLESQKISQDQAEKFEKQGAVGSHMENLQRREGYKGFNQKNVSLIIGRTDPRKI